MKKPIYIALIASVPSVCVALFVLALPVPPQTQVTHANFDRVKKGMAFQEVESILGPFPSYSGNAQGKRASWFLLTSKGKNVDDEGRADIKFDADDRVTETKWTENPDFEATDWFRRVSLHYTDGRFPLGSAVVLFVAILSIVTWLAVVLRAKKLRHWQATCNSTSTADRGDEEAVGRDDERAG